MHDAFPENLQALLQPGSYPHVVETVDLVETHISWILLTGKFAYKIKRPVHYPFVDLRSPERRRFLCYEEVRLNRRFASELYLGVCQITLADGEVRLDGSGLVIEHAVKMLQFPREDELDCLLEDARIAPTELTAFGRDLAQIHADLPIAEPDQVWGRPATLRALIMENAEECAQAAMAFGSADEVRALRTILGASLEAAAPCMSERFTGGRVRECHGDLHVRNIVRWESRLLAFDCLEFEPAFRWIDVADEVAFVLADLEVCGQPLHAQTFLDGYLAHSGDYQACQLLELYKAHRALVRAKVVALSAISDTTRSPVETAVARQRHAAYLECARHSLTPKQKILILMSGFSGSGKSWVAQRLAPLLGAIHLRPDVERKRPAVLSVSARSGSGLGQGLYSPAVSSAVYERLAQCTVDTLAGGYSAIVDATFNRREDRARFHDLSAELGVTACIVHCHAPPHEFTARIIERGERGGDPSEADPSTVHWQAIHYEPIQPEESFILFEAMTTEGDVIDALMRQLTALTRVNTTAVAIETGPVPSTGTPAI